MERVLRLGEKVDRACLGIFRKDEYWYFQSRRTSWFMRFIVGKGGGHTYLQLHWRIRVGIALLLKKGSGSS